MTPAAAGEGRAAVLSSRTAADNGLHYKEREVIFMSDRKDAAALLAKLPEALQDQFCARLEGAAMALDVLNIQPQSEKTGGEA